MQRSFLALQGPASPFFARLIAALSARGHAVKRVNFCGGDFAYSGTRDDLNYQGHHKDLGGWYSDILVKEAITDVLMFGDCRDVHVPIHALAKARGLTVHVFEEGYVRPHWLTLERVGVNGRSLLPRDPEWYLSQRDSVPSCPVGEQTGYNLFERATHDMRYRTANLLFSGYFKQYASHRPRNGMLEYGGLGLRAIFSGRHRARARAVTNELISSARPYFLFPLQLNSDAQIVIHSPFQGMRDAIQQVVRSFAQHAPDDAWLVIKNHPLDTGLIDYRIYTERLARELQIDSRVRFIDAGHLPTLLDGARGVVVVNSTVGLSALHHGRPLITLGDAIYSMPDLTWQGSLARFWRDSEAPNSQVYKAFLDYIVHHTQINGDFYTRTGISMAVATAIERIEAAEHG